MQSSATFKFQPTIEIDKEVDVMSRWKIVRVVVKIKFIQSAFNFSSFLTSFSFRFYFHENKHSTIEQKLREKKKLL